MTLPLSVISFPLPQLLISAFDKRHKLLPSNIVYANPFLERSPTSVLLAALWQQGGIKLALFIPLLTSCISAGTSSLQILLTSSVWFLPQLHCCRLLMPETKAPVHPNATGALSLLLTEHRMKAAER